MSNIKLNEEDFACQAYPHRCAGGQDVNSVDIGVSVFHLPTRLGVICDTERSQLHNKQKAMSLLTKLISLETCLNQQEG